jgi:hypothetical protein
MSKSQFDSQSFKDRLNECHQWPCTYIFKFIAPAKSEKMIKSLLNENLPDADISVRPSSKGKYASVTAEAIVGSADEVMNVYDRLATVPGVISL